MTCSLNEVESLARKAARGAGMPFGIAEEAGKATRWLCAAGLPGAGALSTLLQRNDGAAHDTLRPIDTTASEWRTARDGPLCPLFAGAALCDIASDFTTRELVLARVSCPLLLVPYVVMAADAIGADLTIAWEGAHLSRGPQGTVLSADASALSLSEVRGLRIYHGVISGDYLRRSYRAAVTTEHLDALGAFAHRTYAPDTPESRLAGAGAGLSDND